MLEWKTIHLEDKNFIGMHLVLPKQGIYVITSTKCILVGKMFSIEHLSPTSNVFVMEKADSFASLLESSIKQMNETAIKNGYKNFMSGKEVLLYSPKTKQ